MEERAVLDAHKAGSSIARGAHTVDLSYHDVAGIIQDEVGSVLGSALLDITEVQRSITHAVELAMETGDASIVAELEAQLAALAELHEIKATKAGLRSALAVARAAVRVATLATGV